jgi:hypothetical protein
MIVTIDCNTRPNEMHHLAVALQRIAAENGYVASKTNISVGELTVELNIDTTDATAAIDKLAAHAAAKGVDVVEVPPATVSVSEPVVVTPPVTVNTLFLSDKEERDLNIAAVTDPNLDINGLPWDARIHAGSRERNTDGSWRVRRRPKGVEEADWDATLARVTAELTDLMAIPVSPGAVADAVAEEREIGDVHHTGHALTDAEVDAFVDIVQGVTEPVVVAPPVTIAPPVVVPPVTAVAPPITTASPAIETFPQVMVWLTAHTPKDEAAKPGMVTKVNQILTDNGLTVLQQLNQRPDLIPQIMAQFIEAFGE